MYVANVVQDLAHEFELEFEKLGGSNVLVYQALALVAKKHSAIVNLMCPEWLKNILKSKGII